MTIDDMRIEQLKQLYSLVLTLNGKVEKVEKHEDKYQVYVRYQDLYYIGFAARPVIGVKVITLEPKIEDSYGRYSDTRGYIG